MSTTTAYLLVAVRLEKKLLNGGVQYIFTFGNGRGASVVKSPYSYGGSAGLWEVAVLDSEGELDYATPITSDVIGWQDTEDVLGVLRQIAELPAVSR